jgi:uncharacterized integral membrane protein
MQQTPYDLPAERVNEEPMISKTYIIIGVVAALALAALLIWGVIYLASNHATTVEGVRDILIIVLALESCIFGIVLIMLLIMVVRLVNMLEFEIKPILQKTNETVSTLRGTTTFVSKNVVKPVTKANSYVAATRRALRVLFGDPDRNLPK